MALPLNAEPEEQPVATESWARRRGGQRRLRAGSGPTGSILSSFVLWPVYTCSRVLGLLPLRYSPVSRSATSGRDVPAIEQLMLSWQWLPFCVAMTICVLYSFYFQLSHFSSVLVSPSTTLSDYINEIPMLLNSLTALVCAGCSLAGAQGVARFWQGALSVLAELDALNRALPSTSPRYRPIESWTFFLNVWLCVGLSVAAQALVPVTGMYTLVALGICRLVPLLVETQYLLCCLLLDRCYRGIIRQLRVQTRCDEQPEVPVVYSKAWSGSWPSAAPAHHQGRHQVLKQLRQLHKKVFRILVDVNGHFGLPLLFKLVRKRIQLITDTFTIISVLSKEDLEMSLGLFVVELCILSYGLFVMMYCSEAVLTQDRHLIELLGTLDPTSWDQASNQQLQLLRRQVRDLPAHLHTCFMFTLNYDLLITIVATTSTYLVMLVQFQPDEQSENATSSSL